MNGQIRIGEHSLHLEEPDVITLRIRGDVDEETAVALCEGILAFSEGKNYMLLLCDLTHLGKFSRSARQTFAQFSRRGAPRGTTLFGASFRTRILVEMAVRASNLFSRRRRQVRFVETETQARACFEGMRRFFRNV